MEWASLAGVGGVAVIVGLTGIVRGLGLPTSYAPVAAVVLGVLWNVALGPLVPGGSYPLVLQGVLAGLSAAGLYDVGRKAVDLVQ